MTEEWEHTVVSCLSAATYTVSPIPVLLKGFYVNTAMSAHQAEIRDGVTSVIKTPASMAQGDVVDVDGLMFHTNCVVVCAAGQTGNITVIYKPLGQVGL
jgi:hypothetical protein